MGKPRPTPVLDALAVADVKQERLDAYAAARRARLLADDLGSGIYPTDSFSEKRKAR